MDLFPGLIGRIFDLGEDDYKYGAGPLRVRVTRLVGGMNHRDHLGDWVGAEVVQLRPSDDTVVDPGRILMLRWQTVRRAA